MFKFTSLAKLEKYKLNVLQVLDKTVAAPTKRLPVRNSGVWEWDMLKLSSVIRMTHSNLHHANEGSPDWLIFVSQGSLGSRCVLLSCAWFRLALLSYIILQPEVLLHFYDTLDQACFVAIPGERPVCFLACQPAFFSHYGKGFIAGNLLKSFNLYFKWLNKSCEL